MAACTVAIPVRNQRTFVHRALRSALSQQIPELQVIAVDNCSDDGTWEALQPYAQQGVRLYRNPTNLGLFGNFNRCLELSSSPYLRLLSSDDALAPGCLAAEVALMEQHRDLAMLSTRGRFVSPDGVWLGNFANDLAPGAYAGRNFALTWFDYYARTRRNPLNYPSGVLFRRSAIGGLRFEDGWHSAGDIDFYFKALQQGDLGIADFLGCEVTRHPLQAHVGPNLDGTAIREQLALLERHVDVAARASLLKYLAGSCLALALLRCWSSATRDSAGIHLRLATELATPLTAAFGLAALAGWRAARSLRAYTAPYIPRPLRPL